MRLTNESVLLLLTLSIRALFDNVFEVKGHREAGVELEHDGAPEVVLTNGMSLI
jgi:hypothetical protein